MMKIKKRHFKHFSVIASTLLITESLLVGASTAQAAEQQPAQEPNLALHNQNQQNTPTLNKDSVKNHDPIILVHGFNGFTDDINPAMLSHYWGGDKMNIRQDLEENGYESYEASISAFGSNYDRAVELYYYLKGGRVDYGAAHAAKYGHERYGKTYEGVYKDWQPGKKYISLVTVWGVKPFVN